MRSVALHGLIGSALLALLAACGGGGGGSSAEFGTGSSSGGTGGSSSGSSSSGGSSSGGAITPVYRMGFKDSDGTFVSGRVFIGQSPLAAGGSTGIRIEIVDIANGNAPLPTATDVSFASSCVGRGLSTINPALTSAVAGTASATYGARGCSGNDTITASATVNGTNLSATGSLEVLPSSVGGIEFVSATPTNIGLKGSGQAETSTVVFRVRNTSGGPQINQAVTFSLTTTAGGLALSPTSGTTDDQGLVQTVVQSGTVATVVRVKASATDPTNSARQLVTQSEQLTVSTGIPDQDSFSLSIGCFSTNGGEINGTQTDVTVHAADRFNNPVPDGTAIAFTTEGGSIASRCETSGGRCSVKWTSQDPRTPRSTILAHALGEESFVDADGDGLFDSSERFVDLPEPFVDNNENSVREGSEPFKDFNGNAAYDAADSRFNGLLCDGGGNTPTQCPTPNGAFVRASGVIIMGFDTPDVSTSDISVSGLGVTYDRASNTINMLPGSSGTFSIVLRDRNNQPLPGGGTVAATAADFGTILGTSARPILCSTDDSVGGNTYQFSIKASDAVTPAKDKSGILEIKVTSNGRVNTYSVTVINNDPNDPTVP